MLGFSGPDEIAKKNAIYREAFKNRKPEDQVGFRPTEHLAALCPTIILDDREKARRIGIRGQRFFAESIAYWYAGGAPPQVDDLDEETQLAQLKSSENRMVAFLGDHGIPVLSDATGNYTAFRCSHPVSCRVGGHPYDRLGMAAGPQRSEAAGRTSQPVHRGRYPIRFQNGADSGFISA